MNDNIDRKQILEEFLKNLIHLSNEEYQQRIWVRGEGPECNDIDDAICDFFDDGEFVLEKYKDFGITDYQYQILMKLHKKLQDFTDTYSVYYSHKSTEKLIKIPEWQEIRDIAKEVLETFNHKKE